MSILAEKQDNVPQSVPVQGHQARLVGFPENRPNSTKVWNFGKDF